MTPIEKLLCAAAVVRDNNLRLQVKELRAGDVSEANEDMAKHSEGRANPFTFSTGILGGFSKTATRFNRLDLSFAMRLSGPLNIDA